MVKSLDKIAFVFSLVVLAFLYGFAANARGWFPHDLMIRAWHQAQAVAPSLAADAPDFIAPRVYDRQGAQTFAPGELQPGLTFVATIWKDSTWLPGLKLIDSEGRTLHDWRITPEALFPDSVYRRWIPIGEQDIHGAYLFPNGDILANVEYAGTVRLDPCGEVIWALPHGNHHSISRADDGSFWIPGLSYESPATSPRYPDGYPGLRDSIFHDLIQRVSPAGEVLQEIRVLDVLYENGLERYIPKAYQTGTSDVVHLNDIEPLSVAMADEYPMFEAGDLVISLRDIHLVLVMDPESLAVRWHASDPFIRQHDPDFIGGGWIGVFDNNDDGTGRGSMLGGSRIVALQPHTDSTKVLFPTPQSQELFTRHRGKWQALENGNLLVTESTSGRLVEVAPDGQTVWEWVSEPYDESYVPYVSEGTRYRIAAATVASWGCSPVELH